MIYTKLPQSKNSRSGYYFMSYSHFNMIFELFLDIKILNHDYTRDKMVKSVLAARVKLLSSIQFRL